LQDLEQLQEALNKRKIKPESNTPKLAKGQPSPKYAAFKEHYRNNPVGFVLDCIAFPKGKGPTPYQKKSLVALVKYHRICVRGPHGLGKTALLSWIILWFCLTRDGDEGDWKLPTTAGGFRQLSRFLWPEVHKWARRLRWDRIGRKPFDERTELHGMSLELQTGAAFAVASNNTDLIEGAHATSLLFLFDESKAIAEDTFNAAEGAFATAGDGGTEAFAVAVSTPGEPVGRFYAIQTEREKYSAWWVDNVRMDDVMAAGQMTESWRSQMEREWGGNSANYINRVLGDFAPSDEGGLVPLTWVEQANDRWSNFLVQTACTYKMIPDETFFNERIEEAVLGFIETGALLPFKGFGLDVADGGGDASVIAPRFGQMITRYRKSQAWTNLEAADNALGLWRKYPNRKRTVNVVDADGVGAGAFRELERNDVPVYPFHGSGSGFGTDSTGELEFLNARSKALWSLRELLHPELGANLMLPPDRDLTTDLTTMGFRTVAGAKIRIEDKETIKTRQDGRSPDVGEATAYAFYDPPPLWKREQSRKVPVDAPQLVGSGWEAPQPQAVRQRDDAYEPGVRVGR
jgi:hypothetical protein